MSEELIKIHKRPYGHHEHFLDVAASQLATYQGQGWFPIDEPLPAPDPPDFEVIELKQHDAQVELDEAIANVAKLEAKTAGLAVELDHARNLVKREEKVLREVRVNQLQREAIAKCEEIFREYDGKPVPRRVLISAVEHPQQQMMVLNTYLKAEFNCGKDELGDPMYHPEPAAYRKAQEEKQRVEDAAKEAEVRARMEVIRARM